MVALKLELNKFHESYSMRSYKLKCELRYLQYTVISSIWSMLTGYQVRKLTGTCTVCLAMLLV